MHSIYLLPLTKLNRL